VEEKVVSNLSDTLTI